MGLLKLHNSFCDAAFLGQKLSLERSLRATQELKKILIPNGKVLRYDLTKNVTWFGARLKETSARERN